jgi:hypothetical protein
MVIERLKQKRWLRLVLYLVVLTCLSLGFAYLIQYLMAYFNISIERLATTAYLVVFVVTLASNASILAPVFIYLSLMIAAAKFLDPVLVALIASVAGALGETTGYYAGYMGKKIINVDEEIWRLGHIPPFTSTHIALRRSRAPGRSLQTVALEVYLTLLGR